MMRATGRLFGRGLLLGAVLALVLAGVSQAATLKVTTTKDSMDAACTHKKCSLRDAVTYANAGDTVVLPAASKPYAVTRGEIKIAQAPLTISGAGTSESVIKANGKSRVFEVTAQPSSSATIRFAGLTITGGHATSMPGGGGILVDTSTADLNLVLDRAAVNGNSAALTPGAGVCCGGGGGIYSEGGTITLRHSSVSSDTTTVTGTADNCCHGGGGVYDNYGGDGSVKVVASRLAHDSAVVSSIYCCHGGGAIYEDAATGNITISRSKLRDNTFAWDSTEGSACCSGGGAVYQDSQDSEAKTTINRSTLTGNQATVKYGQCCHGGGAVYVDNGSLDAPLVVNRSTLSDNAAVVKGLTSNSSWCCSGGGAVATFGPTELVKSTLDHNSSSVRSGGCCEGGGGVQINSTSALSSVASTISHNSSLVSSDASFSGGGGVFMDTGGSSLNTFTNSTISGNSTNATTAQAAGGGGLYFLTYESTGTNVLANTTIAGNSAPSGAAGGVLNLGSKLAAKNSIIALNGAKHFANCGAFANGGIKPEFSDLGFNLTDKPNTCDLTLPSDRIVSARAVKLGPLANNGGPTQTRALLKGSAAIDHGDPAGCTDPSGATLKTDQRGKPRPDHGEAACDIGAYEYQDKSVT